MDTTDEGELEETEVEEAELSLVDEADAVAASEDAALGLVSEGEEDVTLIESSDEDAPDRASAYREALRLMGDDDLGSEEESENSSEDDLGSGGWSEMSGEEEAAFAAAGDATATIEYKASKVDPDWRASTAPPQTAKSKAPELELTTEAVDQAAADIDAEEALPSAEAAPSLPLTDGGIAGWPATLDGVPELPAQPTSGEIIMPPSKLPGIVEDIREIDPEYYTTADPIMNVELGWLAFNWRVLALALSPATPVFERLRFVAIAGRNLDEFYMKVRRDAAGGHPPRAWAPGS
eukprot:PRCOL_00005456-RA